MINFKNDYNMGAHEKVLAALVQTNTAISDGYGEDAFTYEAKACIRREMKKEDVDIYFLTGGTQTNLIAISTVLKPHEAVICADTGHINTHETGAVEATGHKVLSVKTNDGKLTPEKLLPILKEHNSIHMVKPKMVYITNSTEIGTIYQKEELEKLHDFCGRYDLYLYLDGARLGSALTAEKNDLQLSDIAALTDLFYIGGTKNGLLFGEALVVVNNLLKNDFPYLIKTRGGLLAKGRIAAVQFKTLFTDGLFYEIGRQANKTAALLRKGLKDAGVRVLTESPTNQQFPILPNMKIDELKKDFSFEDWCEIDGHNSCIRIVTSFITSEKDIMELMNAIKNNHIGSSING